MAGRAGRHVTLGAASAPPPRRRRRARAARGACSPGNLSALLGDPFAAASQLGGSVADASSRTVRLAAGARAALLAASRPLCCIGTALGGEKRAKGCVCRAEGRRAGRCSHASADVCCRPTQGVLRTVARRQRLNLAKAGRAGSPGDWVGRGERRRAARFGGCSRRTGQAKRKRSRSTARTACCTISLCRSSAQTRRAAVPGPPRCLARACQRL
jgi:hypothetical protein